MLDLPRYLLGVAEVLWLAGFATLGATAVRSRLLPLFSGSPAHLATAVIALALLIWSAELLGAFGFLGPVPYLIAVGLAGSGLWLGVGGGWGGPSRRPPPLLASNPVVSAIALVLATAAVLKFGIEVKSKLGTGMTGFDSTWYHAPFAAGFFQTGDTWDLHFIAPQFLAWLYPANAEIFHSIGMLAFDRDVLSPLLNLGWFLGCLVACWCIGRPYGVAPWSLALGAVALSLSVLSDQAGEARNDIVGIFFLLAAVAIAVNAWGGRKNRHVGEGGIDPSGDRPDVEGDSPGDRSGVGLGPVAVAGLAAGLAAGTKLNFLLPAAVLVLGFAFLIPARTPGRRAGGGNWRALVVAALAALAGGGYWYLRNLAHSGNPLPWFDSLGPISLPAPDQALGGREGHSVLGYLFDGAVWSDWFLPGLHDSLTVLWPLLLALALAGLLLCLVPRRSSPDGTGEGERSGWAGDRVLPVVGLTGLAAIAAWLVAPTSASGPDGMPRGFESGLRYLAPAIVLGLAVLPAALLPGVARWRGSPDRTRGPLALGALAAVLFAVAIGYPIQRHYLENRYANPTFATPGLNAAFKWATGLSNTRIATTSTRQYPLFGADLSNHVQYVGEEQPNGGFTAPTTCRQWRHLLNEGDYDYVIASRDRVEPGKPPYPKSARWTEGRGATEVLRDPPTVVFRLTGALDPSDCPY